MKNESIMVTTQKRKLATFDLISQVLTDLSIPIVSSKCTRIINRSGVNADHRGSDHVRIILPFERQVELPATMTFGEFAEACYRIKSHKFDHWYELYFGVSIKEDRNDLLLDQEKTNLQDEVIARLPVVLLDIILQFANSFVNLFVTFDHGS